jgi:hypothetical protein
MQGPNEHKRKTLVGKAWKKKLPCKLVYDKYYDYRNNQEVEAAGNYRAEIVEFGHDVGDSR